MGATYHYVIASGDFSHASPRSEEFAPPQNLVHRRPRQPIPGIRVEHPPAVFHSMERRFLYGARAVEWLDYTKSRQLVITWLGKSPRGVPQHKERRLL